MLKLEENRYSLLNEFSTIQLHKFIHQFDTFQRPSHYEQNDFEIVYMKHGIMNLMIGDSSYTLNSGEIAVIPNNTIHKSSFEHCGSYKKIEYYVLLVSNVSDWIKENFYPIVQLNAAEPECISSTLHLIEKELLTQDDNWQRICRNLLETLLCLVGRSLTYSRPDSSVSSHTDGLTDDIINYLHAHYCEKIELQSVADHFFISPYYLSHLLKKKRGISLMQYVIHLRIKEACMLLKDTNYPIGQIAQMTGYNNMNYFLNVFKQKVGMTPGEYRSSSTKLYPEQ